MSAENDDDPYAERKRLTFEQAEGLEPLPSQLEPKKLSKHLRAGLWAVLYEELAANVDQHDGTFDPAWFNLLRKKHWQRDGGNIDEFRDDPSMHVEGLKSIIINGDYAMVYGLLQWLIRQEEVGFQFAEQIGRTLDYEHAGYRLIDGNTLVPVGSGTDAATIQQAFADLTEAGFNGASVHLRKAAEQLSSGTPADSARESIHAVESVARLLAPGTNKFSVAIAVLEKRWGIHGALKSGFLNLYGYTSDNEGIRHPILDDPDASVDEADAMFMLGACSSMVSYLLAKDRTHAAS